MMVRKRQIAKRKESGRRRDRGGVDLHEGDLVQMHEFEKKDRGLLRKLDVQWSGPYVFRRKVSVSSWEVGLSAGRFRQVHVDHLQKVK